jgi:plasmid stabilization system protein ParE
MSLPLVVLPSAEADLAQAKAWYESNRRGWSEKFRTRVEEAFERIGRMPELHAEIYNGVRRAFIRQFPYAVFYRADDTRVVVIAVMHTRRDPKRWQTRV